MSRQSKFNLEGLSKKQWLPMSANFNRLIWISLIAFGVLSGCQARNSAIDPKAVNRLEQSSHGKWTASDRAQLLECELAITGKLSETARYDLRVACIGYCYKLESSTNDECILSLAVAARIRHVLSLVESNPRDVILQAAACSEFPGIDTAVERALLVAWIRAVELNGWDNAVLANARRCKVNGKSVFVH
jgi:hypothetical protein